MTRRDIMRLVEGEPYARVEEFDRRSYKERHSLASPDVAALVLDGIELVMVDAMEVVAATAEVTEPVDPIMLASWAIEDRRRP